MSIEQLEKLKALKLELEAEEDLTQTSQIEQFWEEVFAELGA